MDRILNNRLAWGALALALSSLCLSACGTHDEHPVDAGVDAPMTMPGRDGGVADGGGSTAYTFHYQPSWKGVTAVSVVGGFGQATDWTQPLVTLQPDAAGGYSGSATLPAGQYLYLFEVTGDDAAATPATFKRYAIDPQDSDFAACPMQSPSFDKGAPNPCSRLTLPAAAPAASEQVSGTVTLAGAPVADWLVVLERDEPASHHFFADRVTTAADGSFSFAMAPGTYRVQVQTPSYLAKNDVEREAMLGNGSRRAISSAFAVTGTVTLAPAEVGYPGYAQLQPRDVDGGVALPTTFSFSLAPGASRARLTIYGTGMNGKTPEVGDPWFAGPLGTATTTAFDGTFNTMKATEKAALPGERYFWGTEQENDHPDGGVAWTRQSEVLSISFR